MTAEARQKSTSFFANTLSYVKPFVSLLPQVKNPIRKLALREKIVWTTVAVLIYLLASQVPLFGIIDTSSADPLAWMRMMMASNRGTLMDLGISPVITSSMVIHFITTLGIVQPDFSIKEDKILLDTLQKLIALLMTVGQSIVQIASGYYGSPKSLGFNYCAILFIQLLISGVIIVLLDEMLQKGYGLGNGVNLFIVTNVCERIIWNAFSPRAFYTGRGLEFEGCLISLVHLIFARKNKLAALNEIFFRQNLPNLSTLLFNVALFCAVVYLHTLRVEIPIISRTHRGVASAYPVNLLYTTTMPVTLQEQFVSFFSMMSRFFFIYWPKSLLVRILGVWDARGPHGFVPVSGISYYICPPHSFADALSRPFFTTIYLTVVLLLAGLICKTWVDTHEDSSEAVYKRLKNQDMQLKNVRDGLAVQKLNEYIPTAAFLGGVVMALIIALCNISPMKGAGSNIFLAVSIINQYMKLYAKESATRAGKAFID
ncbi:protein transport protein SEC61 subunit alpha [Pancytospora philotis]|nr:protein transport protein SEC61 subunit alpha [Pancytospora philotis]